MPLGNSFVPLFTFSAVRRAARRCGLKEVGEDEEWTVYWTDCSVSLERVMEMKRFQVPSTARVEGAEKIRSSDFSSFIAWEGWQTAKLLKWGAFSWS